MKEELATRYEPSAFEQRIYADWEKGGYFTPVVDRDRPKFSIVIPPPNVTGRLHIGHALVNTLQDIIVRWKRMSGFNTLWVPGTDHAGIATQMVVERKLAEQGISRLELGRDKFVEHDLGVEGTALHRDQGPAHPPRRLRATGPASASRSMKASRARCATSS